MSIDPVTVLQSAEMSLDLFYTAATADDGVTKGYKVATYTFTEDYDEVLVVGCDSEKNGTTGDYLFQYNINSDASVKYNGRTCSKKFMVFSNIKIGDTFKHITYRDSGGLRYLVGMKYIGINYSYN